MRRNYSPIRIQDGIVEIDMKRNMDHRDRQQVVWEDKFVENDDYFPILGLTPLFLGNDPLAFKNTLVVSFEYADYLNPGIVGCANIERKGFVNFARVYKSFNFFSGMLSLIGYKNPIYQNLDFNTSEHFKVRAEYDIFFIAAIRKPYTYNYEINHDTLSSRGTILKVKEDDLVILVNEEKFHKNKSFISQNYSSTFRKITMNNLKYGHYSQIKRKVVSNDYLENFIVRGELLKTKSLSEIVSIQSRIIDQTINSLHLQI